MRVLKERQDVEVELRGPRSQAGAWERVQQACQPEDRLTYVRADLREG